MIEVADSRGLDVKINKKKKVTLEIWNCSHSGNYGYMSCPGYRVLWRTVRIARDKSRRGGLKCYT